MEGQGFWGTTNIKVASAVATFGGKLRPVDPTTRFVMGDGSQRVTFWFLDTDEGREARNQLEKNWNAMTCDEESPIRYVRAALENRETLLGLVKRAEPIQVVQMGGQTLLVPLNASSERKKAFLRSI